MLGTRQRGHKNSIHITVELQKSLIFENERRCVPVSGHGAHLLSSGTSSMSGGLLGFDRTKMLGPQRSRKRGNTTDGAPFGTPLPHHKKDKAKPRSQASASSLSYSSASVMAGY